MSVLVVGTRFCRRQHALLLVDPPHRWKTVQQALDALRDWPFHSADALMFYPRLMAQDRLQGRIEVFPPSAAAVRHAGARAWRPGLAGNGGPGFAAARGKSGGVGGRQQRISLAQRGVNSLRATRAAPRDVDVTAMCTLAGGVWQWPGCTRAGRAPAGVVRQRQHRARHALGDD